MTLLGRRVIRTLGSLKSASTGAEGTLPTHRRTPPDTSCLATPSVAVLLGWGDSSTVWEF